MSSGRFLWAHQIYIKYTIFNIKKRETPWIILNRQLGDISKGLKNEFETAVVNEPSVFEPLKVYHIYIHMPLMFHTDIKPDLPES